MKRLVSVALVLFVWPLCQAQSQTFAGTNAPAQASNFVFTVATGATNLSLVISNNASAWSYLFLKKGGDPTDVDFDFVARLQGRTNEVNLETPEFMVTNYGLRVTTPATSGAHIFQVLLTTNRSDLRSAAYPALKPLVFSVDGALTNTGSGSWNYFQVDMPSNLLTGWRLVLSSTNTVTPDLYLGRNLLPTTSSYDKRSTGNAVETVILTSAEATNSTYFIGVYQPSGAASSANYTLSTELASITTLTWDPGTTDPGTQTYTNQSVTGGDYFFAITTLGTANGVWRTALNVQSGEADLYLQYGALPSVSSYRVSSTRVGSDGFVLSQLGNQFAPGQNWYLLVRATPGAQWNLVTGEAYVQPLSALAPDSSSSAAAVMGSEGIRYFRTTISAGTLGWRVSVTGLSNQIYVKKTAAPHPYNTSTYDLTQAGQMLVVPTYLSLGDQYFVGVVGPPGLAFTLDSRQQEVRDVAFNSATNLSVTAYGYTTFRVQVPVQQIAWQLVATPTAGDVNVAVRRDAVPNEFVNDAFSDVAGITPDSVTLVPPALSDGTFYVTVYGIAPYSCSLTNGNPVITDVDYVFQITNDAPSRVGWRVYRVPNTAQQLGTLGWELDLASQPPGTEIAIRRNAVPSRWNYRTQPSYISQSTLGYVDQSSLLGFLQEPNHQADIWYIGVYSPTNPLGSFVLTGSQLTGQPLSYDGAGSSANVVAQPVGKLQFFRFDVPVGALGWDIRITNVTSGDPRLVVCRNQLPEDLSSRSPSGGYWYANSSATWPSGYQWAAGYDWTGYTYGPNGTNEYGHLLQMGMGNPLEPGTYFVGVLNGNGTGYLNPMSYTLVSRGIGPGLSIPVTDLAFTNGTVAHPGLPAREAAYYRVVVPTNLPSWKVRLGTNSGESLLILQKDALPNVGASSSAPTYLYGGRKVDKAGNEHYLFLPNSGQSNIVAGTYYLAVASEGMNPRSSYIGTNSSSFNLTSLGLLPIIDLGTVDPTGTTDLTHSDANEGGESKAFQFAIPPGTLAIEVHLDNAVGNPYMTLRADGQLPAPYDGYGNDGGQSATWQNSALINIANPTATNYTLMVQASYVSSAYPDANYTIRLHAIGPQPLAFDAGSNTISGQLSGTWQYFTLTVPPGALGWDLRITNVTSGDPRLVVARDLAPKDLGTHSPSGGYWYANSSATWPSGYQWAAGYDWTGYTYGPNGTNEYGHLLQMGMGNPLEPGTYFVGVLNGNGTGYLNPMSYTLVSRGIGPGLSIPVTDLAFTNGTVAHPGLPAREAAYYRVVVPTNLPDWKLRLTTTSGESLLALQKDALPNVGASSSAPSYLYGGRKLQKSGNEQYLFLPSGAVSNIAAGTYFLLVASEGMNPRSSYAGTNVSAYTLTSYGVLERTNLGTVGATDLVRSNALQGGEAVLYQFTIPPSTPAVELRLEDRTGNPYATLVTGPYSPNPHDSYGNDGGVSYSWYSPTIITLPNAVATNYSLTLQADYLSGLYPDANCTLRVRQMPTPLLNFAANLNTNGYSNVASGTLADGQSAFFQVTVPATNNGQAVLGWRLNLTQTAGSPKVRVRPGLLPDDYNYYNGTSPFATGEAIIAPPYLAPGVWYVEVRGQGITSFTLTSSDIQLYQPAWTMPVVGDMVTTPGLPPGGPLFGDSGVDAAGIARPGDQGIDLEQGSFHFYAISVSPTNIGLLRTRLDAISGDPNLYIRVGAVPTLNHNATGQSGSLVERSLTANVGSEYGNWVPLTGRYDHFLTPGTWFLAVKAAGNSNVRYRLRVYTGIVNDLALNSEIYTNQILAGGDWMYYRVQIPTNAPVNWKVTFAEQLGNVIMSVRDTVPPGQASTPTDLRDWSDDAKNHGPYPAFDAPGTYALVTPPVRPGSTYYLGFRAVIDTTFAVSCNTDGGAIDYTNVVPFYAGNLITTVPALSALKLRIDVPAEARRLILNFTNSTAFNVYLDQGSVPTRTTSDHWYRQGTANPAFNQALYNVNGWPWLPGYMYFLYITNTSTSPQAFSLNVDGRNCATDDYDNDTLPDCWELTYWPGIYSYGPNDDPDADGVRNRDEFLEGTDPTDAASFHPRLLVNAQYGSVNLNPPGNTTTTPPKVWYNLGQALQLTAVPDTDYGFLSWTGDASGSANPLSINMDTHKTVAAVFGLTREPNADYQFQLNLHSSVGTPPDLTNIATGNLFVTDTVDGAPRTVYRFPQASGVAMAPADGVIPTNVYTMVLLFSLDNVSGWRRILDFKNPAANNGLYVNNGRLNYYPVAAGSTPAITASNYVQVVLTRDASSNVVGYVNGVQQFSFLDSQNYAVLAGSPQILRFFKDDGSENPSGAVARIRLYDKVMPPAQIALLDRLPGGVARPRFLAPFLDGTGLNLPAEVVAGLSYRLQGSTNLIDWFNLSTNTVPTTPYTFTDSLGPMYPARFYRLVTP